MEKIYLVSYRSDLYDGFNVMIFATKDRRTANNYVTKFNRILYKWREYYSQFEKDGWLADEHLDKFHRWDSIRGINRCYYEVISAR